jgi:hypothetical protein
VDDRKKTLELFAQQLSEGLPFAEDFLKGSLDNDVANNALITRNLSEDALKRLVDHRMSRRLIEEPSETAIQKMSAFIANNPMVQHEDLVRYALEIGHEPNELITRSLGSVLTEKNSLNLNKPLPDLLNELYSDNPVPGHRYVVDPNDVVSPRGKSVVKDLDGGEGVSVGYRKSNGEAARGNNKFIALKDAKSEADKMRQTAIGIHELDHGQDRIIRPNFKSRGNVGDLGHHFGPGTSESRNLIREVRDLPVDTNILKEIKKRADAPPSMFKKLRSVPVVGPAIGLGMAAFTEDSHAAIPILNEAENLGPEKGSEDWEIENPQASPELRRQALQRLTQK